MNTKRRRWHLHNVDDEDSTLNTRAFDDFIRVNEFDAATQSDLRLLKRGQTYAGGGGAAPAWWIKRIA